MGGNPNRQSAQMNARNQAMLRLQNAHPDEWDEIYREERVKHGLPAELTTENLVQQNRYLRYRVEELERRLNGAE